MSKGQTTIGFVLITTVVGVLSFLGGGSWLSKGQAEQDRQIAILETKGEQYTRDMSEVRESIKNINNILLQWAERNNVKMSTTTKI